MTLRSNSTEKNATVSNEAVLELAAVAALGVIAVTWLSALLNVFFPDGWEEAEVYMQLFRCQCT